MDKLLNILNITKAVYLKNRRTTLRAYPHSFMIARTMGGAISIIAELVIYFLVFQKELSGKFLEVAGTQDYVTYIVLGQAISILSFATLMNVGRCLIGEIREGTIDNFILSPASRIGYFLGVYIEQLGRSLIEILFILLFGLLLGMRIPLELVPSCMIIVLLSSLSFFSVAILISTVMVYTRDTYLVQNTFYIGMEFMCGVLYPIEFMPAFFQYVSKSLPLTHVLSLFRKCILSGEKIMDNSYHISMIIFLSAVYLAIGYCLYIKKERKLVEEVLA